MGNLNLKHPGEGGWEPKSWNRGLEIEFLKYVRTKKNDFRNRGLLFGQISFYVDANVRTLRYSRSVGTYTRDFKF